MAKYRYFAELMIEKRKSLGFNTSRKYHSSLENSPIEYQSWTHIESGRRLPKPETATAIADLMDIPREQAILAYSRDLFQDPGCEEALNNIKDYVGAIAQKKMVQEASNIKAGWHELTTRQWRAFEVDQRLYHVMSLPFPADRVHVQDLSEMIGLSFPETLSIVSHLESLGLFEVHGEFASKIYRGVKIPVIEETAALRQKLTISKVTQAITEKADYKTWTINLTDKSKGDILKFFDLINAKCLVGHEEAKQSEDVKTYNILVSLNPVSTRVGV